VAIIGTGTIGSTLVLVGVTRRAGGDRALGLDLLEGPPARTATRITEIR
jgi:hypothetical protein